MVLGLRVKALVQKLKDLYMFDFLSFLFNVMTAPKTV